MRSGLYSFIRLSLAFEKRQESAQRVSQVQQHLPAQKLRRSFPWSATTARRAASPNSRYDVALARSVLLSQMPPRARNRKPFVIQQPLDPQHHLDIFLPIKPVPARTLDRLQHRKLRLPIPQNKRLQSRQPANFANPIKIFLNPGLRRCRGARHLEFQSEGGRRYPSSSRRFPVGEGLAPPDLLRPTQLAEASARERARFTPRLCSSAAAARVSANAVQIVSEPQGIHTSREAGSPEIARS
jgi:hypothetical protein